MNANELADLLADSNDLDIRRAVAMLRQFGLAESIIKQQQLEIEALKDKLMLAKQSLEIVEGWIKE